MYIPDHIRVVVDGKRLYVYSADEGHATGERMQVRSVSVVYDELQGLSARVEYGTRIHRLGYDEPQAVNIDYPMERITIEAKE